jgi:hypothetical protein
MVRPSSQPLCRLTPEKRQSDFKGSDENAQIRATSDATAKQRRGCNDRNQKELLGGWEKQQLPRLRSRTGPKVKASPGDRVKFIGFKAGCYLFGIILQQFGARNHKKTNVPSKGRRLLEIELDRLPGRPTGTIVVPESHIASRCR